MARAARGVDVLVIATPDGAIAPVAAHVAPVPGTVVLHLSGALGLDVLSPHPRRASLHPLVPLPSPEVGRVRLRSGITFAVAGDAVAGELARLLGGSTVVVGDDQRAAYHAAACIAANHLVGLMGQVERVAASAGLGLDSFVGLARGRVHRRGRARPRVGPDRTGGPGGRGHPRAAPGCPRRGRGPRSTPVSPWPGAWSPTAARPDVSRRKPGPRRRKRSGHARPDPGYPFPVAPSRVVPSPVVPSPVPARSTRARRARSVRVVSSAREFSDVLESERALGRSVGLVPTMGALHDGHRSLVARAAAECDVVAVTVFVNPLQFEDVADLAAYPRDLDGDVAVAGAAGASVGLAATGGGDVRGLPGPHRLDGPRRGCERRARGRGPRPGHFDGVATVVAKLFALSGRCRAYFGEKDYQQLAVIRRMAADLSMPVEIVACPTVRGTDGLALSSRNARLSPAERDAARCCTGPCGPGAPAASRALSSTRAASAPAMAAVLGAEPLVTIDYAEVVDPHTLQCPPEVDGEVRLLVAARVGPVRLIDNEGAVVRPDRGGIGRGALLPPPETIQERNAEPCAAGCSSPRSTGPP